MSWHHLKHSYVFSNYVDMIQVLSKTTETNLMGDFIVVMLQDDIAEVNRKIQERIDRRKGLLLEQDSFLIDKSISGMQYS